MNQNRISLKKRSIFIVGAIVLVVGAGCATVLLLQRFVSKQDAHTSKQEAVAPVQPTPSVEDTMTRLRKDIASSDVPSGAYKIEPSGRSLQVSLRLKHADSPFVYAYTPSVGITIAQQQEGTSLLSVIRDSFTDMLYQKQEAERVGDTETTVYKGTKATCQVQQLNSVGEKDVARYVVGCVSQESIDEQTSHVTKLLELASQQTPKQVTMLLDVNDHSMSLQSFMLTYDDTSNNKTVFFATTKGSAWEYIGERPVPSVDNKESFTMSPQLQQAVADTKWNGFLQRYIR